MCNTLVLSRSVQHISALKKCQHISALQMCNTLVLSRSVQHISAHKKCAHNMVDL